MGGKINIKLLLFWGFERFLQLPERFLAVSMVLQWFGRVYRWIHYNTLQKAPKSFPAFAKTIQNLQKKTKSPSGSETSTEVFGAGEVFMVFDVFAGFGRFLQMPERFLAALQGFVIVWKGVLPKPLQHRAKAPKTFPAFAKTIQNMQKPSTKMDSTLSIITKLIEG